MIKKDTNIAKLREISMSKLTKQDFIALRDDMELNWDDSMRGKMQVLGLACIKRFGVLLSKLEIKSKAKAEN